MTAGRHYLVASRAQLPHLMRELERRLERASSPLRIRVDCAPSRTREQNAYLHVALRALADHTGANESELRDYFKAEYGPTAIVTVAGHSKVIPKSLSTYSIEEASDMIEHVERVAAECGLLLAPLHHGVNAW
jgi:AraC-like DNA-binding protein